MSWGEKMSPDKIVLVNNELKLKLIWSRVVLTSMGAIFFSSGLLSKDL